MTSIRRRACSPYIRTSWRIHIDTTIMHTNTHTLRSSGSIMRRQQTTPFRAVRQARIITLGQRARINITPIGGYTCQESRPNHARQRKGVCRLMHATSRQLCWSLWHLHKCATLFRVVCPGSPRGCGQEFLRNS